MPFMTSYLDVPIYCREKAVKDEDAELGSKTPQSSKAEKAHDKDKGKGKVDNDEEWGSRKNKEDDDWSRVYSNHSPIISLCPYCFALILYIYSLRILHDLDLGLEYNASSIILNYETCENTKKNKLIKNVKKKSLC